MTEEKLMPALKAAMQIKNLDEDGEFQILLIRREGEWQIYTGAQAVNYGLGREQVSHMIDHSFDDDDISWLDA